MWKPLKYHRTKDGRVVLFVQNQKTRVLRKQNFKHFDELPVYIENPKYIIETGYSAREPQVGDIVANIEMNSISFGEVLAHENHDFLVRKRDGLDTIWTHPRIVHHNIEGMFENDTEGAVNTSHIPIRTLEEFNLACEFFVERTYEQYFSEPPIGDLSPEIILGIHHSMFGRVSSWGGAFRNRRVFIGRNNHEAPVWTEVPKMMEYFCTRYSQHLEIISTQCEFNSKVALQLAQVYFEFCNIHPFTDGNGRTSRFLVQNALSALDRMPTLEWHRIKRFGNRTDRAFEQIRRKKNFSYLSNIISRATGQPFPQYDTRLRSP